MALLRIFCWALIFILRLQDTTLEKTDCELDLGVYGRIMIAPGQSKLHNKVTKLIRCWIIFEDQL